MLDAEKRVAAEPAADATDQRRCIGWAKFGIEAHGASDGDFPIRPGEKDGLGRMCKPHRDAYEHRLARQASYKSVSATIRRATSEPRRARSP